MSETPLTLREATQEMSELLSEELHLSPKAEALLADELDAPVDVSIDTSLRLKVIDRCGMTCTFCHNEGTPVAVDNLGRTEQFVSIGTRTQRASIYVDDNGVDFLPGTVSSAADDTRLGEALDALDSQLETTEIHLTGGEPTLHPNLAPIIRQLKGRGLGVKITSNGENFAPKAAELAEAGLDKVVFSIFGTTPEELAAVQAERYQNPAFGERKLQALDEAIIAAHEHGISVSANIVMPDASHAERVMRIIERYGSIADIRVLNSLDEGNESYEAVYELFAALGARPLATKMNAGASGMRTDYALPDGSVVGFKKIRKSHLEACDDCEYKEKNCQEGYYGVRLYVDSEGDYRAGVCIQRMDLTTPIDAFIAGDLPRQIAEHRLSEYEQMCRDLGANHG